MSNQIKFESTIFTFFGIISNPKFSLSLQSQVLYIVGLKVFSQLFFLFIFRIKIRHFINVGNFVLIIKTYYQNLFHKKKNIFKTFTKKLIRTLQLKKKKFKKILDKKS